MHHEKKGFSKSLRKKVLVNSIIVLLVFIIVILWFYLHAPAEFWWPIKFIDVVNVIAQIATASAFFLAIHQYRKSKDSERQKVLVEESRILVTKMKFVAESFLGNKEPMLSEVRVFMDQITSHASNFDAIFKELNEDIHKAIVRMHWQDMYFIEFGNAVAHFNNHIYVTNFGVSESSRLRALAAFNALSYGAVEPVSCFELYIKNQFIVNFEGVKSYLRITSDDQTRMFLFEKVFFDNEYLNDHLYGCTNQIDIRVRSPLIAVLNELSTQFSTGRDLTAYRAFLPINE